MKRQIALSVVMVLCLNILIVHSAQEKRQAPEKKPTGASGVVSAAAGRISILNPLGNPPPITLIPMAPRPAALEGKTVYFVDDGFLGGDVLLKEMIAWFGKNMPSVKTEFRKKAGGFAAEDPSLWAEIKEKGDAMVMATGH